MSPYPYLHPYPYLYLYLCPNLYLYLDEDHSFPWDGRGVMGIVAWLIARKELTRSWLQKGKAQKMV